jgi:hypothetical protein
VTTIAEALILVRADTSRVDSDIRRGAAGATKSGSKWGKALGLGITAGAGAILAGGVFLKGAFDEAEEAAKVAALTAAAIESTGGAANVTAEEVAELSEAMSAKVGMDDELIQSGANLLLTFKNVRNEVGEGNDIFNKATEAAVDLSAAGFGSVTATSKQLGKALNDPLKGITALGRAGVTFTEDQEKMIEKMVESGDILGAQKAILKEVNDQVGGAAEATAADKIEVAWANTKERLGNTFKPFLDDLMTDIAKGDWSGAWQTFRTGAWNAMKWVANKAKNWVTDELLPNIIGGLANLKEQWKQGWRDFWKPPDRAYTQTEQRTDLFAERMARQHGHIGIEAVTALISNMRPMPSRAGSIMAEAVGEMVRSARNLPGKLGGIAREAVWEMIDNLWSLGDILYNAGAGLIQSIIDGINSKLGAIDDKMKEVAGKIGGFLPGSPIKEGPLTSWNNGGAGKRLIDEGIIAGLDARRGAVGAAMGRATAVGGGMVGAAGGGRGGVALTITNWQDGTGYIQGLAAGEIADDRDFGRTLGRMRR